MKTAVITGYGGLEKIEFIESKKPHPENNELLIMVESFALNPKDILIRKGKFKRVSGNNFPKKIGFEFAGTVVDSAAKSQLKPGDRVFGLFNGWQGQCSTKYICIEDKHVWKIPEKTTFEQASGIALAGLTALQALRDLGKISPMSKVCINGASGGVGSLAVQIAKQFKSNVTTISSQRNLKFCYSLGADDCIAYDKPNLLGLDNKYDIFFDVFGNYSYKKIKYMLSKNGRYITTVPSKDIFKQQVLNMFRNKKAKLVIVKSNKNDLNWLAKTISNNKIFPVIDKIYPFSEIKAAQSYLETKRARGKVIITLSPSTDVTKSGREHFEYNLENNFSGFGT